MDSNLEKKVLIERRNILAKKVVDAAAEMKKLSGIEGAGVAIIARWRLAQVRAIEKVLEEDYNYKIEPWGTDIYLP